MICCSSGYTRTSGASFFPFTGDVMSAIEHLLKPHVRDLGDFTVRRLLPAAATQTVGPFIFFDHMGPVQLPPGAGADVRPHPHIGLATVTYMFEGEIVHRD